MKAIDSLRWFSTRFGLHGRDKTTILVAQFTLFIVPGQLH